MVWATVNCVSLAVKLDTSEPRVSTSKIVVEAVFELPAISLKRLEATVKVTVPE